MNNCVMKQWLQELSWKTQSALMTSIRGNDEFEAPNVRNFIRWIRSVCFYDADASGTFVKFDTSTMKVLKSEIEYMRIHFLSHLMHGLEIIAYKHPNVAERNTAFYLYDRMCDILHCNVESEKDMDNRLVDNREKIDTK